MMDFKDFSEQIMMALPEYLTDAFGDGEFRLKRVRKNNGIELAGITYQGNDVRVSPIVYLDDYYSRFMDGEKWGDILKEIAGQFNENKAPVLSELNNIFDLNKAKHYMSYRLINAERNEDFLKDHPHIRMADLAIVFVLSVGELLGAEASVHITNDMLRQWDVSKEALFDIANENVDRILPLEVSPMISILEELSGIIAPSELLMEEQRPPMAVVTNKKRMYGASAILYKGAVDRIRDILKYPDFYIIPSSIHECICIPADTGRISVADIKQMIREVNRSEVRPEEFLSDNLYTMGENGLVEVEEEYTADPELMAG